MAQYRLEPSNQPPNRGLLPLLLLLVIVIGLMILASTLFWLAGSQLVLGPTATPTATPRERPPATPDFRATRSIEDSRTAAAYAGDPLAGGQPQGTAAPVQVGPATATLRPDQIAEGTSVAPDATTPESNESGQGETFLPNIVADATDPAPTPAATVAVEPTATPVVPPTATPTQTPLPTATATPVILDTPTPTSVVLPTAPAQPTVTPTAVTYTWYNMAAVVRGSGAAGRVGPSITYETEITFNGGDAVKLNGRTESGEWVFASRTDANDYRWIRQADVDIRDNTAADNAPDEVKDSPNNVRWLDIIGIGPNVEPLPVPTPLPNDDWPVYRRTPDNRGRAVLLPVPPWSQDWLPAAAGGGFISPVVVTGSNAVAASSDKHLYSINRYGGNQRWRNNQLNNNDVFFAPAIQQNSIYVVDNVGIVYHFIDQGSSAALGWQRPFDVTPTSGINLAGDFLYFTGTNNSNQHKLIQVQRYDAETIHEFAITGSVLTYPAVGDQMVYVGGDELWARDKNNVEVSVWNYGTNLGRVTAPPVYVMPGKLATAELYVGEENGTVHVLDANIGTQLATVSTGRTVTGIAVDEERLYVAGAGQIAIYRRDDLQQIRTIAVEASQILGGPVVDGTNVLVVLESGNALLYSVNTGELITAQNPGPTMAGVAVGGQWILLPGSNGNLYNIRGSGNE